MIPQVNGFELLQWKKLFFQYRYRHTDMVAVYNIFLWNNLSVILYTYAKYSLK